MTYDSSIAYRQLLASTPMYLFLDRILKPRWVRYDYVRTESKGALMIARIACELDPMQPSDPMSDDLFLRPMQDGCGPPRSLLGPSSLAAAKRYHFSGITNRR